MPTRGSLAHLDQPTESDDLLRCGAGARRAVGVVDHRRSGLDGFDVGRARRGGHPGFALDYPGDRRQNPLPNLRVVAPHVQQEFGLAEESSWERGHMLAEHDVGARDGVVEAVLDHGGSALRHLLGGLKRHHDRARPGRIGRQDGGCAEKTGHVHVVSTGVHDGDLAPVRIDPSGLAGERQTRLLGHGQRVRVGPQQDHP